MAFNFPSNPTLNQTYTEGIYTFTWNGSSWVGVGTLPAYFDLTVNVASSFEAANSAGVYANSGFIKANGAFANANGAFANANAAFVNANAAFVRANAAFIQANAVFNAVNTLSSNAITSGTSNVRVESSGGNVQFTIGGTTQTTMSPNLVAHNESVLESVMFRVNSKNVTSNIVISNTYNYMSIGPMTINSGITVNVANGARWVIV